MRLRVSPAQLAHTARWQAPVQRPARRERTTHLLVRSTVLSARIAQLDLHVRRQVLLLGLLRSVQPVTIVLLVQRMPTTTRARRGLGLMPRTPRAKTTATFVGKGNIAKLVLLVLRWVRALKVMFVLG
jgi:hypothetical protein